MEKQLTLTGSKSLYEKAEYTYKAVATVLSAPMRLLGRYYSAVLERDISHRQTRALTEAQAAFFLFVFPADYSLLLRAAACIWCYMALKKCRRLL